MRIPLKAWLAVPTALIMLVKLAAAQTSGAPLTIALGGDGLHFAALHVAQSEGFFAQEGLNVKFIDVGSGPKSMAAVLGGSADLSPIGATDLIKAVGRKLPAVAVSTCFDVYPTTLVLSNKAIAKAGITPNMTTDEKVKRIAAADLTIGITTPGSATDDFMRSLLKARGYDPDKVVNLQPIGPGSALYAAFEKGTIDGFVWFSPFTDLAVVNKLGSQVLTPLRNQIPEMQGVPYLWLVTSRRTLATRRVELGKAIVAYTRALKLIADDPATARKLLHAHFNGMNSAALDAGITTYLTAVPKTPVISPSAIAKNAAWMSLTSPAPVKANYDQLVAPDLAEAAKDQVLGR
jgi:NitT/TauT family transport system substrate-binding protein